MPRIKIIIKQIKFTKINIYNIDISNKFVNINTLKYLKKIIIPYSDKKINVKPPLKYSILNPETNSDSPSIKSMGLRFNSAKILIKNIINKGYKISKYQKYI